MKKAGNAYDTVGFFRNRLTRRRVVVRHFSLKRKTAKNNDCGEWRITLHHDRRLPVIEVKFGPSGIP